MLNLSSFVDTKLLQTISSFLVMCEGKGHVDVRFIRQTIQNEVTGRFKQNRVKMTLNGRARAIALKSNKPMEPQRVEVPTTFVSTPCPQCGESELVLLKTDDLTHLDCKGCRMSWEIK